MKSAEKNVVQLPKSKFLKVACKKCRNEQIIYNKASSIVKCLRCGTELAKPTGGKATINARVMKVFE